MPNFNPFLKHKAEPNPALEIIRVAKRLAIEHNAQRAVLQAFFELCEGDFCYRSFGAIAGHSKLDWKRVRVLTRQLARYGLVVYANGLFTEEGEVAGSGDTITSKGRAVARLIEEYRNAVD